MKTRRVGLCLVVAATLAGCAPPRANVKVRTIELPAAFDRAAPGRSVAGVDWRDFFTDDDLRALIAEAIASNPDLQIALQRIEIARAGVRRATGVLLPEVSFGAGGALHRFGRYTVDGAGNATTEITPGRAVPSPVGDLSVSLQASWEVDLWGKLRSLRGSARAQYLATIEGANLVITNLVAEVAVAYFDLLALDHVRDVLTETIARQTEALAMMRIQKEAGRTNELAVQQFEAELAGARALDASTLQQTRELEGRLNVLLGRLPRPIPRTKEQLHREIAPTMAAGVPSELLRNRPDLREAELQVQAARLDLEAARAAFYPSLTISAGLGYQAFHPRFLLSTPESLFYSVAAGLVGPLVNRRGIEADLAAARATQLQAMYQYRSIVLGSFAEVASGLSAIEQAAEVVAQQRRKRAAVAGTVDAADALFRAGKATYVDVLLAQQRTFEAELELIESLRDQRVASIQLYKALGGGWRGELRGAP